MGEPRALEGMRVIVTGASRGVGRAIAIACARHGATVGVNFHRSETEAREVAATIGGAAIAASVRRRRSRSRAVRRSTHSPSARAASTPS